MKKRIVSCLFIVLMFAYGCGNSVIDPKEGVTKMTTINSAAQDNLTFMMEKYGFSADELEGLDLEKFISRYELRTRDYTAEEIREKLNSVGDRYKDDGTTRIYSILEAEETGSYEGGDVILIGFYYNSGTFTQRAVFDLESAVCYIDTAEPNLLTDEQIATLKSIAERNRVASWDSHYEGEEEPSTGNYSWKLVFQVSDGTFSKYDGYTQDMSHLPDTYNDVKDELISVIKSVDS